MQDRNYNGFILTNEKSGYLPWVNTSIMTREIIEYFLNEVSSDNYPAEHLHFSTYTHTDHSHTSIQTKHIPVILRA